MNANYVMNGTAIVRKAIVTGATTYLAKGGRECTLLAGESFGAACVVDEAKFTPKARKAAPQAVPQASVTAKPSAGRETYLSWCKSEGYPCVKLADASAEVVAAWEARKAAVKAGAVATPAPAPAPVVTAQAATGHQAMAAALRAVADYLETL